MQMTSKQFKVNKNVKYDENVEQMFENEGL